MNDTTQNAAPGRPAGDPPESIPLNLSIDPASMTRLFDLFREALGPSFTKPHSSAGEGVDLKPADRIKAADLRVALLLGKIPEDTGMLIDTRTFSRLLSISSRHLSRLLDEEAIPDPIRLGRLLRWRLAEVLEWIEADCPPQKVWVHRRQDSAKRSGK